MDRDEIAQDVKVWLMVLLTLVFVILYILAVTGRILPPSDDKLVLRLEPIMGVIIGYFFGRVPSFTNEKQLARRARDAEARTSPALQARLEALRSVLAGDARPDESMQSRSHPPGARPRVVEGDEAALRHRLTAALKILERADPS
jgi:hypothetical protein